MEISAGINLKLTKKTLPVSDTGVIIKMRNHHEIHYDTVNRVTNIF